MSDIKSLLESIDRIQLNELSQRDQREVDAEVEKIQSGSSTYADVEAGWNALDGGRVFTINNAKQNAFLGDLANKLNVRGMYNPDSARMGGIVLAVKDENSTRYRETGTAFGLGMPENDAAELARLRMLPAQRLAKAREEYPDNPAFRDTEERPDTPASDSSSSQGNTRPQARPQNDGSVRLEGGETFDPNNAQSRRLATARAGELYRRYQQLIRKINESAPISLRGYLKEHGLDNLLFEELSMDEQAELQRIYRDLNTLINSGMLSSANTRLFQNALADAPQVARDRAQTQAVPPRGDTQATELPPAASAEAPPEAQAASNASDDADATVEPGEQPPSSSLEAFARSGKGGLANDTDEVDAIKELQEYLNDLGFDVGTVDGRYGRRTIAGVKAFQEFTGARQDGDAGPETIGKIIRLRTIRWDGGQKTFADFRRALTRAEELITKAGGSTTQESNDMRKYLAIFERILNEALTDTERTELSALLDKLDELSNDAEWASVLPQPTQQRLSRIVRDGRAVIPASAPEPADDAENDAADSTSTREPRTDAEIAADPDRDGNADDPEAQTFIADTPSQARQLALAMNGPGTDEEKIFDVLQSLRNPQAWQNLKRAYQEDQNEDLMTRFRSELNDADFIRYVRDPLEDIGVQFDENGNEVQAQTQQPAATSSISSLNQMPVGTPEQRTAFFRAVVQNQEVMRRLTADEQRQLRDLVGEQ